MLVVYNVYLELIVAFWLVSSYHPYALCLNLHIPSTQQVAGSLVLLVAPVHGFRSWWLFSSIDHNAVVSNQFMLQLLTIKLLL